MTDKQLPVLEICEEFVAWLDKDMSLIEPSHLNVSVADRFSVPDAVCAASSLIFVVEAYDCRSDCDQCCDDDLDSNSLSWRSLSCENKRKKICNLF